MGIISLIIGEKMRETVLSIDHGKRSGFSAFINGKYIKSGTLNIEEITSLEGAYEKYRHLFFTYLPDIVVVEKVNVAGSKFGGNNVIKLAQLQAMIILLAQQYGSKIVEVNPLQLKKALTGNGRAEKREVAECVAKMWSLDAEQICVPEYYKKKSGIKNYLADESDAIALGTYYVNFY